MPVVTAYTVSHCGVQRGTKWDLELSQAGSLVQWRKARGLSREACSGMKSQEGDQPKGCRELSNTEAPCGPGFVGRNHVGRCRHLQGLVAGCACDLW